MTLNRAFTNTTVSFNESLEQIAALLAAHGVRDMRHTQRLPTDPNDASGEAGEGLLVYEFLKPAAEEADRRGVRLTVKYRPTMLKQTRRSRAMEEVKGTTAQMAARALYWLLKAKFDAIDYGIEDFDVAFMPHLRTALGGPTFAESPQLLAMAIEHPAALIEAAAGPLALAAGDGERGTVTP
jgi:hypothetical protein